MYLNKKPWVILHYFRLCYECFELKLSWNMWRVYFSINHLSLCWFSDRKQIYCKVMRDVIMAVLTKQRNFCVKINETFCREVLNCIVCHTEFKLYPRFSFKIYKCLKITWRCGIEIKLQMKYTHNLLCPFQQE